MEAEIVRVCRERKQQAAATPTVEFDCAADAGERREILDDDSAAVKHLTAERAAARVTVVVQHLQHVFTFAAAHAIIDHILFVRTKT